MPILERPAQTGASGSRRTLPFSVPRRLGARARRPIIMLRRMADEARWRRPVRWGNLRRTQPFTTWGSQRGQPIDRFYIEAFLAERGHYIKGRVLEVGDDRYIRSMGGSDVSDAQVVDLFSTKQSTLVADLNQPGSLPAERFDCFICTQVLQYIPEPDNALANAWSTLVPGGTLFLSVPTVSRLSPRVAKHGIGEYWRFTEAGVRNRLEKAFPSTSQDIVTYGNVLTAAAFLMGLAAEDLQAKELDFVDPYYPMVVCARLTKSSAPRS